MTKEQAELSRCLASGAEQVSWAEYQRRIAAIGYRVETREPCAGVSMDLNTGETFQETTYPCTHIASGLSFAHVDAPRDSLYRRLQSLRMNMTCLHRGRIRSV